MEKTEEYKFTIKKVHPFLKDSNGYRATISGSYIEDTTVDLWRVYLPPQYDEYNIVYGEFEGDWLPAAPHEEALAQLDEFIRQAQAARELLANKVESVYDDD